MRDAATLSDFERDFDAAMRGRDWTGATAVGEAGVSHEYEIKYEV